MRWTPYGPNALLFHFADQLGPETFAKGRAIVAELEKQPSLGLVEFVPAFTTVLLEFDPVQVPEPRQIADELAARLEQVAATELAPQPIKEIPVTYTGPDLERVAQEHRLTIQEIQALHAAPIYQVYMLGFSPGFPYLGDLDPKLHTPRLASPRPLVRAGSVAIGGEHTGIYTVDGPGGWNIIGHTSTKIFDPARARLSGDEEAMFFLQAGDRVKFVPTTTL
jgi:inhibitor of KinA